MRSSTEFSRHTSVVDSAEDQHGHLLLSEPVEDPLAPARGILIACCISLALWLGALAIFF